MDEPSSLKKRGVKMAKKMEMPMGMHMMHGKCCQWFGWLILLIGVWFLLTDLGILHDWNVNWWTVVFLLMGIKMVAHQLMKK